MIVSRTPTAVNMEFANTYMDGMKDVYAPGTIPPVVRRYKRQAKDLMNLKDSGKISTTSPQKLTADDVKVFLVYRRSLNLSLSELRKDISALKNLCEYCNNIAVSTCLRKYPTLKPSIHEPRLPSMTDDEYQAVLDRLETIPNDFRHVRAYCVVSMFMFTGTRTRELRLSEVDDINTSSWEFTISHPKGEGSYGQERSVPLPPCIRGLVSLYLSMREEWMSKHDVYVNALFPSYESTDGYLSDNTLRQIKCLVEKECHIKFDFRKCRRTFGQQYIDKNLNIESVSVLMGHSSTQTTEKYYCRQKNRVAIDKAKDVWGSNGSKIDFRKSSAGYENERRRTGSNRGPCD